MQDLEAEKESRTWMVEWETCRIPVEQILLGPGGEADKEAISDYWSS